MKSKFAMVVSGILLTLTGTAIAGNDAPIKIGVLAKRGADKCLSKWTPTAEYLSEKMGRKVVIQPLKFDAVPTFIKSGKVDFFLVNSSMYCDMKEQFGGNAVASLVNKRQDKTVSEFAGVIFVKADSPIKTLEDVKGKRFACVKKSSFGGYQMAKRLLQDHGIDPEKDCSAFKEAGTHDKVVQLVEKGVAEVGTVRSDTLERMAAEGKCKLSDFRILNQQEDKFPFVHSTQLYPEWPIASCKKTDSALAQQLAQALKDMPADSPAAKSAKCVGWSDPLDYSEVRQCLVDIKYGVFADKKTDVAAVKDEG